MTKNRMIALAIIVIIAVVLAFNAEAVGAVVWYVAQKLWVVITEIVEVATQRGV